MLAALSPSRRLVQASLILLLPAAAGPTFAAPLDLRASNIAPADTRSAVAPALPVPAVALSAPPLSFLEAARRALAGARTGEAQEALERAETRLLDGTAQPVLAAPSMVPALASTRAARQALAVHDRAGAAREIDAAIAALSASAAAARVPASGRRADAPPAGRARGRRSHTPRAAACDQGSATGPLGVAWCEICVGAP